MKDVPLKALLLILFHTVSFVACQPSSTYEYQMPELTNDGWQTTSLDDVGIDERTLGELIERIEDDTYQNIHSILIVKDGKLVFEEYFGGYEFDYEGDQFWGEFTNYDIDTIHNLASVTKAITSALVGIAIDNGFIKDVNEKVYSFFPEYSHLNNEERDRISLEHLLTMTSGLEWNEMDVTVDTRNYENDLIQLFMVSDPIEYILAKPVVAEAGTRWYYSGGDVNLLGEVIRKATGLGVDNFAEKYLFTPLGISDYQWNYINPYIVYASGDLKLRPRDMAKFGYLYLNDGVWNSERVVSEEWIEDSTREYTSLPNADWAQEYGDRYGYQWFLQTYYVDSAPFNSFLRDGWGGQRITVFPDLDMVVVLTGGNYAAYAPVNEIITRHILPAVR
jgi:CubicO group peptidase (beta-lactamase class C family)